MASSTASRGRSVVGGPKNFNDWSYVLTADNHGIVYGSSSIVEDTYLIVRLNPDGTTEELANFSGADSYFYPSGARLISGR